MYFLQGTEGKLITEILASEDSHQFLPSLLYAKVQPLFQQDVLSFCLSMNTCWHTKSKRDIQVDTHRIEAHAMIHISHVMLCVLMIKLFPHT